jgi:hypothetical protein
MTDYEDEWMTHTLSNYTWSEEAIRDWTLIWARLWKLGFDWQWKNGDRYVRRQGESFAIFMVHEDAERLDGAIPIPQIHIFDEIKELLLDRNDSFGAVDHAIKAVNDWLRLHFGGADTVLDLPFAAEEY